MKRCKDCKKFSYLIASNGVCAWYGLRFLYRQPTQENWSCKNFIEKDNLNKCKWWKFWRPK